MPLRGRTPAIFTVSRDLPTDAATTAKHFAPAAWSKDSQEFRGHASRRLPPESMMLYRKGPEMKPEPGGEGFLHDGIPPAASHFRNADSMQSCSRAAGFPDASLPSTESLLDEMGMVVR